LQVKEICFLQAVPEVQLGALALKVVLKKFHLRPVTIYEVITGNVVAAGQGQNLVCQAMMRQGDSHGAGAYLATVNGKRVPLKGVLT
jgi:acetyl-CoA acetyltransferase